MVLDIQRGLQSRQAKPSCRFGRHERRAAAEPATVYWIRQKRRVGGGAGLYLSSAFLVLWDGWTPLGADEFWPVRPLSRAADSAPLGA